MHKFFIVIFLIALFGCATPKEYAPITRDFSTEHVFRNGKVLSQYRYFYSGPQAMPDALLALDRRYTLSAKFWTEIDLTEEQLQNWVKQFDRVRGEFDDLARIRISYDGMAILDRSNQRIGIIYSRYDWVVAWFVDAFTLTVTQPQTTRMYN